MVNSEELIGTTEYLTQYMRFFINQCRYNRVRLYLILNNCVFNNNNDITISRCLISYMFRLLTAVLRENNYHKVIILMLVYHLFNIKLRWYLNQWFFFPMARQPLGGLGHLIFWGFTITHSLDTPHSVGFLWTRDQLVAEISTWQHTTLTRDRHPCHRRDSNPKFQ
jgi:hypothetical protein